MDKKTNWNRIATPWAGWAWYDNIYLVDPNGNRYSQDMIKASSFAMELAHQIAGSTLQIRLLKNELKRKLELPPPDVIVRWNGQETVITPEGWKNRK